MKEAQPTAATVPAGDWREVGAVFLRLGLTAFGGPVAHLALMEDEIVRRRAWVTREEFLDLASAANLIPGPNSTELAIHLGYRRAGWRGLLAAGVGFILPAALIVTLVAWFYVRFGRLPAVDGVFHGMKPVIVAIVTIALWNLGRSALKSWPLAFVAAGAMVAAMAGAGELTVLFSAAGLVAAARAWRQRRGPRASGPALPVVPWLPPGVLATTGTGVAGVGTATTAFGLGPLFLFFLKVGSVLFGSGYVLLAFLRADLVDRWGWLTEAQLLDAVAVGQFTPGPLFTTATFVGYLLGGPSGAFVATAGIFLPAFVFVALSGPLIPRLRASPTAGAFLDGLNVASLALMATVTGQLSRSALADGLSWVVAGVSAILLVRCRVNSAWLVAAGAAIGWFVART